MQKTTAFWKYLSLDMVMSLTVHTSHVLYLAMSPDSKMIVTGVGDETLWCWNAFPKYENHKAIWESRLDNGWLIQ